MRRVATLWLALAVAPALADRPLVAERLVFNWHNFLSGCSTWSLADWNRWTDDAAGLGYNGIMVHAYGNNPLVGFSFNGRSKPVGELSTTAHGRDWSTNHVNDVRRLVGGHVFEGPVFGSAAALGPAAERPAAVRAMMRQVFDHAAAQGMGVFLANDVDTGSANPQDLVRTLPVSDRFRTKVQAGGLSGVSGSGATEFWLPNPDTAAGAAYYRAQVAALLADYPSLSTLVVWFRNGGTPWMDLALGDLPASWQAEYRAAVQRQPAAERFWRGVALFAIGKIVRAYQRALQELGATRVRLAAGTWNFAFLPAADLFFPPALPLIGLDYEVLHGNSILATPAGRQKLAAVGAHRPLIPVIWAHHDDGAYLGRPFTPFEQFHSKLAEARAAGFGIIHWMTRPLELFFASHIRQVFEATRDEPLAATCRQFGGPELASYLQRWITTAPQFTRETSNHLIDRPLINVPQVIAGCRERLALLGPADSELARYYRGLEEFCIAFYQTQEQFQRADERWQAGDLPGARRLLADCQPEEVIRRYAAGSQIGGITRGEQGLVVSLNTRWLVWFTRLRQAVGLEPVRYAFAPTSHDELAQAAGRGTFYWDRQGAIWQTLGTRETGATAYEAPAVDAEIARHGLETAQPLTLTLQPILQAAPLPAGDYRLRLLAAEPSATAAGQRGFDVQVTARPSTAGPQQYRFAPTRAKWLRLIGHGSAENAWNSLYEITSPALGAGIAASASAAAPSCEAALACDGRPDTRWAALGDPVWLQLPLRDGALLDQVTVTWYRGAERQYRVEFAVSDDGQTWHPLLPQPAPPPVSSTTSVDLFARAGGARRLVEVSVPVTLSQPGVVDLRLLPRVGSAVVSGVMLEPLPGLATAAPEPPN